MAELGSSSAEQPLTTPPVGDPQASDTSSGLKRVLLCAVAGGAITAATLGVGAGWKAGLIGWDSAVGFYLAWVWLEARRLDGQQTADHAVRDDMGRGVTDVALTAAAVLSLVAVVVVLSGAGKVKGFSEYLLVGLGIVSLLLSWLLVHTVYLLKYARRYYEDRGGVQFEGTNSPDYGDFAYLSFTVGMCYQVSDTGFTSSAMRRLALRHALVSYLFGAAILASAINIIAGLSGGG